MIRLDRRSVQPPDNWAGTVAKAFPDFEAFRRKAEEFEVLDIDDPERRKGFVSCAEEVLPKFRGKPRFRAIWGEAKEALAEMSHWKCAYCETELAAKRSAQVEHFRPKSLFPLYAYDWDNYFLGCGGCNGAKGDQWPAAGGSFVRPDGVEDPAELFEFLEDGTIRAAIEGGPAAATIPAFGLNRNWLCRWRKREISSTLRELETLLRIDLPEELLERLAHGILDRVSDPTCRYSAALRRCFLRAWTEK